MAKVTREQGGAARAARAARRRAEDADEADGTGEGPDAPRRRSLILGTGALGRGRLLAGFAVALVVGPLLTWGMHYVHADGALVIHTLVYQLLVLVVALVGGWWPAVFSAVAAALSLDVFFVAPTSSLSVAAPSHLVALALFVASGMLMAWAVDLSARRARAAVAAAREAERLRREAVEARVLAEADRVRTALLGAVGHDLRRPLAAAGTAIGALRTADVRFAPAEREELLATADAALGTLSALVTDLLDVSRLQAGAVAVHPVATDPAEVVLAALDELGLGPAQVAVDCPQDVGPVSADPALLQRVLVNLLTNALRYQPTGRPVLLRVRQGEALPGAAEPASAPRAPAGTGPGVGTGPGAGPGSVSLAVVDEGPGIPAERRDRVFAPFQRLGDSDNTAGLGLGLAVARGFAEGMGGGLTAEDTPGGGLTMTVRLQPWDGTDTATTGEDA